MSNRPFEATVERTSGELFLAASFVIVSNLECFVTLS
jgi:hypothetical protein